MSFLAFTVTTEELHSCGDKYITETPIDINILSDFLSVDTTLRSLVLNVPLSSEDVRILADGLKHNNTLEDFATCGRYFNSEDMKHLTDAFRDNTSLRHVRLSLDSITEDYVSFFTNLSDLELNVRSYQPATITALISQPRNFSLYVKSILHLRLVSNDLTFTNDARGISSILQGVLLNKSISSLCFHSCDINVGTICNILKHSSQIKKLCLSGVICTSEDFLQLMDTNLEILNLRGSDLIDISPLKYNTTIKSFEYGFGFYDIFYDTKLLGEIFRENNILTEVKLTRGRIDSYVTLIGALSNNNTLEKLKVCGSMSIDDMQGIMTSLESNYTLKAITQLKYSRPQSREYQYFFSEKCRLERMAKVRRLACTKRSKH